MQIALNESCFVFLSSVIKMELDWVGKRAKTEHIGEKTVNGNRQIIGNGRYDML